MINLFSRKAAMPDEADALPGRTEALEVVNRHFVNGNPIQPPFPEHLEQAVFGLGCFWGAERKFWLVDGVYSTAVGYSAGANSGLAGEKRLTAANPRENEDEKLLASLGMRPARGSATPVNNES